MSALKTLHRLQAVGFQTGSVRFGCENPNDEDWVVRADDWSKIVGTDLSDGFYYMEHEYDIDEFRCFFLDYNGVVYNFIVPWKEEQFRLMKKATALMLKVPVKYIQNKSARVMLFETFKRLISGEMDKVLKITKPHEYTIPKVDNNFDDDIPF